MIAFNEGNYGMYLIGGGQVVTGQVVTGQVGTGQVGTLRGDGVGGAWGKGSALAVGWDGEPGVNVDSDPVGIACCRTPRRASRARRRMETP